MNTAKVYLTTPSGRIAILKEKICAVLSVEIQGLNDTVVKSQIYVDSDSEPFNVLEDFDYVCNKI